LNIKESVSLEQVEAATGIPASAWENRCHEVALAIVKSDLFDYARVARGYADGIRGQHSWVVLDHDVYSRYSVILDPTYNVNIGGDPLLWWGTLDSGVHHPKGAGSIWDFGAPGNSSFSDAYHLNTEGLSASARSFIHMIEPLNRQGWASLAHFPMQGWPSGEIIERMYEDENLRPFIPIDIVGMVTDINPSGLYLK